LKFLTKKLFCCVALCGFLMNFVYAVQEQSKEKKLEEVYCKSTYQILLCTRGPQFDCTQYKFNDYAFGENQSECCERASILAHERCVAKGKTLQSRIDLSKECVLLECKLTLNNN